jgi:tetratricopeptide (TPR) repeat protein
MKAESPNFRTQYNADAEQLQAVLALLFESCMKERLPLEPDQAKGFATYCMHSITGGGQPGPQAMNLILELTSGPMTAQEATLVAFTILKEYKDNALAWWILACTSQMDDVPAMIFTVGTGFQKRSGNIRDKANAITFALPKLLEWGKRMDPDAPDKDLLIVLGMLEERSSKYAEALHYYERALNAEPEKENTRPRLAQDMLRLVLKRDWDGVASMKARLGDRDGARETLELGAFEKDDPIAWYQLARMNEQDSTLLRDYLHRAAKGGIPEATKLLGIWYVRQSQIFRTQASSKPSLRSRIRQNLSPFVTKTLDRILGNPVTDNLRTGIEWLRVAAFYGGADNYVFLGLALREIGQHEEGFKHIEKVKDSGDFDFEDYKNNWNVDIPLKDKTSLLGHSPREIENMLRQ